MQPGPVISPLEDAVSAREAELLAESRYDAAYALLVEAAQTHPDPRAAAALALRAAVHAQDHLDDGAEREAYALALQRDPSCETALSEWCRQTWTARAWSETAELLERLAVLTVAPADRAERFATAAEVWGDRLDRADHAREAWVACLRALPPAAACGAAARRILVDTGRIDRMLPWLSERVAEAAGRGDACAQAEARLARGRLLAADPARRDEAVADLVQAAAVPGGAGSVALLVLGGLHGAGEGWTDLVGHLEREASTQAATDTLAAAAVLRRVVRACLAEPPAYARAERALRSLLALDPEDAGSAEALVGVLGAKGRHREAVDLLSDLARVAAPNAAALYLMRAGVMELARFGDRAASLAFFEEAFRRNPRSRAAATHLKEAYREMGRWADLARVMVAEVEDRRVDAAVLGVLREAGLLLRDRAGDVVAASEVYKRIVAHDPMDDDAVAFFEDFHRRIDRETPALDDHARAAAAADSPEERLRSLLRAADAALRLGSPIRARTFLEAARAESPDDTDVRERLWGLLETWGEYGRLADAMESDRARVGEGSSQWATLGLRQAAVRLRHLGEIGRARALLEAVAGREVPEAATARARLDELERGLCAADREGRRAADEIMRAVAGAEDPSTPEVAVEAPAVPAYVGVRDGPASGAAVPELEPAPAPEALLAQARESLTAGAFEEALILAEQVIETQPASTTLGRDARELAADVLLDNLGDTAEGLDRLAALGRDRSLPLGLRRRVSEARVRILERDLPPTGERDLALAEALADAAAVAEGAEVARSLNYRRARLLSERPQHTAQAIEILRGLLLDAPDSGPLLELLAGLYEREQDWTALAPVLERSAALMPPEEAAAVYGRLADLFTVDLQDAHKAMTCLQRALERLPGHLPTLKTLARIAREVGDGEVEAVALRERIAVEREHERLPQLHYALAETLEKLGRPQEALVHYRRALESDPRSLSAHHGLIRAAETAGELEVLTAALASAAAVTRDPSEAAGLHARRGKVFLEQAGNVELARSAVQEALRCDVEHPDAISLLRDLEARSGASPAEIAQLLRREAEAIAQPTERAERLAEAGRLLVGLGGDPAAGAEAFRAALESVPGHATALAGLARIHREAGEDAEAGDLLERLVDSDAPEAVRSWALSELGVLHEAEGAYAEAFERHEAAASLDPENPAAQLGIGALGIKIGRLAEAAEGLAAAANLGAHGIEGAPRDDALTETLARLGAVRRRLGDARAATRAFRQVLERDPAHRGALTALAVLLEVEGDWHGAAEMRERIAMDIPDPKLRASALAAVGAFLRDRADDPRQALGLFRKSLALDDAEASVHSAVLVLAERLGKHSIARDAALACARLASQPAESAEYLVAASRAAAADGEPEGAISLLRSALEQDPGCASAIEQAAELLGTAERRGEAVAILRRAIPFARGEDQRLAWTLVLARLLQDAGDPEGAAGVLAEAAARQPTDEALLLSLAGGPLPPPHAAGPALRVVSMGLADAPLDRARLLAAECLAAGAGQADRAFVYGSLLELVGADSAQVHERLGRYRARMACRPSRPLEPGLMELILPRTLLDGERFHAQAESALLALPEDRRSFAWPASELAPIDADWASETRELSRFLGLPVMGLGRTAPGTGVRILPTTGRIGIAADLFDGRSDPERRFVLAFGLVLSVAGRRWVTASDGAVEALDDILTWVRGEAPDDLALEQGERFGLGLHRVLRDLVHDRVPTGAEWVEAAVLGAARIGLVASGDPAQALPAVLRLLTPEGTAADTPDMASALLAHPTARALLAFVHSDTFFESRRALGLGSP